MNKIRKRRDNLIYYASKTEAPTFKYTIETSTDNYSCNFPVSQIEDTMVVNWGDGTTEQFTNVANISHTYTNIGTYQISISHLQHLNKMPRFNFKNSKILKTVDTPFLTMYSGSELEITEVNNMFSGCNSLTTIPQGLFDNNTAVTSFNSCFDNCTSLTAIPQGLFDNNTAVTNFGYCFYYCTSLTTIPAGLFDNNTAVTSFSHCFSSCSILTTIPAGLFDNNTAVTDFSSCFDNCTSLTTIPQGLFDNNTSVTNFSYCFYGCSMLKLNSNIFCDEATEKTTRFANNRRTDFSYCFNTSQFTGEKGTAPALWEYTYAVEPTTTSCFNSKTIDSQITNASEVPTGWKS